MTYVRERYHASKRPTWTPDDLRAEFDRVQRGIPHPPVTIDMRDFAQPGRDFAAAVQRAHDALPTTGGVIRFPQMSAAWLLDGNGATVASPKRGVNITKNNVWIVGDGETPIHMANWDQTDAASAGADTAGQDVFTFIRFTSGVVGGGVWGLYVTGESDDSALSVGEARAKVIGCDGAHHIRISDVRGVDIVGNVVNARGDNTGAGAAGNCRDIFCVNVYAENCAENGINYMGGTYDCKVIGGAADDCEFQGLETGTYGVEVVGFRASGNKNGISHVGRHGKFIGCHLNGNTTSGFSFQHNSATFDSAYNSLVGCHIYENAVLGITAASDSHDNEIANCHIWDNGPDGDPPAGTGEGIKLAADCERFTISGGHIYDTGAARQRYAINTITPSKLTVRGVRTYGNLTWSYLQQSAGDETTLDGCNFEEALVSISATATNTRVLARCRGFTPSVVVASADTIALPETSDVISISGTTTINTITATAQRNRRVTLCFQGSLTVNDNGTSSGNVILAGGANFSATANDTLTLASVDATNWLEVARSVN